jgi:NAD(P)-dependent dehydrogenase (short-subunit alcohol dehydrogenase family)
LIRCIHPPSQLVNNSGTTWGAPLTNVPEEKGWDRVLGTNVKAVFYLTAGLASLLEKNATATSPGRVVNITSVAGIDPKAEDTGLSVAGVGKWCILVARPRNNCGGLT